MRQKYILTDPLHTWEGPNFQTIDIYEEGTEIIVVDKVTLEDSSIWFQIENTGHWIYYRSAGGWYTMQFVEDLEGGSGDGGSSDQSNKQHYEKYKVIVSSVVKRSEAVETPDTDTGERFNKGEVLNVLETIEDKDGSIWGKVYNQPDKNSSGAVQNKMRSNDPNHPSVIGTVKLLQDTELLKSDKSVFGVAPAGAVYNVVYDKETYDGSVMFIYKLESGLFIKKGANVEYTKKGDLDSHDTESYTIIGYATVKYDGVPYGTKPNHKAEDQDGFMYEGARLALLELVDDEDGGIKLYKFKSGDVTGYITSDEAYITVEEIGDGDDSSEDGPNHVADDTTYPSPENPNQVVPLGTCIVTCNEGIYLRHKASWDDSAKTKLLAPKGSKLYVLSDKIQVGNDYMYKVAPDHYIPASSKYITYTSNNVFVWVCIYHKPTNETRLSLYVPATDKTSDFIEPELRAYYRVIVKFMDKKQEPSEDSRVVGKFQYNEVIQVMEKKVDDLGNVWVKTEDGSWGCYYYADYNVYYMEKMNELSVVGNMVGTVLTDGLNMRADHNTDSISLGHFYKGQRLKLVEQYTDGNSNLWVRTSDGVWACAMEFTNGKYIVHITMNNITGSVNADQTVPIDNDTVKSVISLGGTVGDSYSDVKTHVTYTTYIGNKNRKFIVPTEEDWHNPRQIESSTNGGPGRTFPRKHESGGVVGYDYTIETNVDTIKKSLNIIHKEINYPFAYDRSDLGQLYHQQFNRFRVIYPDYMIKQLIPVMFITRPDLNLFNDSGSSLLANSQIDNDPVISYLVKSCPQSMSSLTKSYIYGSSHNFNPLLSNLCEGVDIVDEYVDVFETGETFTGFKTAYAKSNIKSMASNQLSVKFKETYDLSVTKIMQGWVRYESCVYRGELTPKDVYLFGKIIDYCCNIYQFLLDPDMETIRFWSKYYGAFPVNVNKSIFNADMSLATGINTSEVATTFQYYKKKDFDVTSLVEFNMDAGSISNIKEDLYNKETGLSGRTWVNAPFITTDTISGIGGMKIDRFKLNWKPGNGMEPSASINK